MHLHTGWYKGFMVYGNQTLSNFCFTASVDGTSLSWSKMAVGAPATKSMFQAAEMSGERRKAYSFPFKETTQKFHATHDF